MIKKYFYYLIKKISEKSHRNYYANYYADEIKKFKECDYKKNNSLIKKEMSILKKYWNAYPFQYFRYHMYRKDCILTIEQMKDYIPDYFAYYMLYPRSFKERNMLCEDKSLFAAICRGYNINQPKTLFTISNQLILDSYGKITKESELVTSLKQQKSDKIFFKPTNGVGGRGIIIFEKREGRFYNTKDDTELTEQFIVSLMSFNYIIQLGLVADIVMKNIYPNSINTFRIVTRCKNNHPEIVFTILRIGQSGSLVDNASSGGMYIKVDKKTGRLNESAFSFTGERITSHPDTGFIFSEYQLPFWNEIITFAEQLAICFKEIEYIGWDITYTENGPTVIEANNGPDISLLQDCYGGVRKEFGIDNPKSFWYSENYALKDL